MRLIGHLPSEASAVTFSDYLCVQGIDNEVESDKEGWAVWVHAEDDCARASRMLEGYRANPQSPEYAGKAAEATRRREAEAADREDAERRIYDREAVFRASRPYGVGALTLVLLVLCVALSCLAWAGYKERIFDQLLMTRVTFTDTEASWVPGLKEIRDWEFWRLLTPAFIHIEPLHLLFNMLWLLDLGSMIEGRLSTGRLGLKVLLFGVLSNLAQFFLSGPMFYGFSGVNYGLFGYIWVRGRMDPRSGLYLPPHIVAMMIIWYLLCFTGVITNVANAAHAAGLGLGIIWGFLSSLPAQRRGGLME